MPHRFEHKNPGFCRKRTAMLFFFFCLYLTSHGQVIINEYSCSNVSTIADNYSNYEDWVELYNTTTGNISLNGFYLSDDKANILKWQVGNASIPAGGHLLIWCSGRNVTSGTLHTSFKLTQTKPDALILSDASGTILDSLTIKPALKNHSRGRALDGLIYWNVFTAPTPGTSNSNGMQEYATMPSMSYAPGFYNSAILISLTSPDPGVTIYYTTDGSDPTLSSSVYATPVSLTSTTVLRARAFSTDPYTPASFTASNTYFINDNHSTAVISLFGGQSLDSLLNGEWYLSPETGTEYFDNTGALKAESYGTSNKHGNDSWYYDQRGIDFISRDQYGYNYALNDQLFHTKNRSSFQRIILKAAANDNYPFEPGGAHIRDAYVQTITQRGNLHLDARTWEPCVIYINGKYWGVYELREKADDSDYTSYYYSQPADKVQMLKTWGSTWSEYGGAQAQTDWDNLRAYISSNSMAVQSNYDYVDSLFNIKSLVDYFVLNSYVVCSDWLNWNTAWWRGLDINGNSKKWKYILWDEDATFGHYINYTGIPNTLPNADPCAPQTLGDPGGQGHVEILNSLLNNPGFRQYYVSRFIDLSNTTFNCSYMQSLLDSMINLIQPEMQAHVNRWGGSLTGWQTDVQILKTYISSRCQAIGQGLISCYQLTGPFDLKVNVAPAGAGSVQINSITPSSYAFSGTYFGNINILLRASSDSGYVFDHWELYNNSLSPGIGDSSVSLNMVQSDSVIAHFRLITPIPDRNLTVTAIPDTAGKVKINALTLSTFPWTGAYPDSTAISATALPDTAFFTFDHWEAHKHVLLPDSLFASVLFKITADDTLVAHFIKKEIPPIPVQPVPAGDVFVPTAFSPNEDGYNDVLFIYGGIKDFEFKIFNRWGEKVFETSEQSKGWDGSYDGKPIGSGVFAYTLKGKLPDGTPVVRNGNITLMR